MGCVSSSLLNQDEEFPSMGSAALGHHFVSLTSTTYGLLTLDPPLSPMTPPTPPPRFTLAVVSPSPDTEVINSWELMAGLDSNSNSNSNLDHGSFRFSPLPRPFSYSNSKPCTPKFFGKAKDTENINPNMVKRLFTPVKPMPHLAHLKSLEDFPRLCPPDGENKVILYTTSLRGVRNTFEACNAVRSTLQVLGFSFSERDISMDRGFREDSEELKRLLLPLAKISPQQLLPPRLFIKGRYVGAADEVLRIHEEGGLLQLLQGLPRLKVGTACDGCGDLLFLPCFRCGGSCKLVDDTISMSRTPIVMRCPHCNENGLALCPICS